MKTSRKVVAAMFVVLSVSIVVAAIYLSRLWVAPSISLAPTTFVAVQGTQIGFTVYGLESNGVATVYFGDGHEANTTSSVAHAYENPGRYLVAAQEFVNDQPIASTFESIQLIQVSPNIGPSLAPLISVPVISFDVTKNPSAPVVQVGDGVSLYGGYLEAPSGTDVTIAQYIWDYGNGITRTINANNTSLNPADNPVLTRYNQPGLYPVTLTLVTENLTSNEMYKTSTEQTVAVGSASHPYVIFLYGGVVPNPSVITEALNFPGGPYSLDPHVDAEGIGYEVITNIFSTLLIYNGSSTTNFIPVASTQVPSIANGEVSPDYMTYTFQMRRGLKFSNGDPLTAYDVWYSVIRSMLFLGGTPGTSGWILAQYLVAGGGAGSPIITDPSDTVHFDAIMSAVIYSNASDTVTFRLVRPVIPQLFFTAIANGFCGSILDSRWLQQVGAGITFTPAGFYAYQNQANSGSYNLEVQNNPVSSGPYMIQSYVLGQSLALVPNPGFSGVPGIPEVTNTVVIQWVKDSETAYNLFRSGQADIAYPSADYFPLIKQQVANGQAALYQYPLLYQSFFCFNLRINETAMKENFGPQYHIPSDYFANLKVRKAFAYAFDYTKYVDEIQGNAKYGIDLGRGYAGVIIQGMPYYVPESELQNVPTYNLTYARQLLEESGAYDTSINIPLASSGDVGFEGLKMWASAISSIDPNIVMTPTLVENRELAANWGPGNSLPLYAWGWGADYAYPSDVVDGMYKEGVYYPAADGWSVDYLNSTGHFDQAAMYAQMNSLIEEADSTTNATLAAQDYKQVEQIAINLYMYVYTFQWNGLWVVKPYMIGYQGQISYQMNPLNYNASLFFWWIKTCGSLQSCSVRKIGP